MSLVPNARQDARFLVRRLRWNYGIGFFNGSLLVLSLHILEGDLKAGTPWFLGAFLLLNSLVFSITNWRSHQSDCRDLEKLVIGAETEMEQASVP